MKTQLLFCTVILLVPFFRSGDCRALDSSTPTRNRPDPQAPLQQSLGPFWIRNGEEYLMLPRKDSKDSSGVSPTRWQMVLSEAPFSAQLQHILREPVGDLEQVSSRYQAERDEMLDRGKRLDDPPTSLDLTFHLLREVLEMARAEQMEQQAHSNRKIMELIG
ncbi:corticoliberin-1-like [Rhincodon typus]|uniref:corticoliberin-1-like n=1 Tax=Rhincodon typus TaxID=259920 RepID=UPI00202EF209|nr:corticoliberin-1-like [Rhincodon typus]